MQKISLLFILLCFQSLSKDLLCMERERHPSASRKLSPAKADKDAIVHESDSYEALSRSVPLIRKLPLSLLNQSEKIRTTPPSSPKTVSLDPAAIKQNEEKEKLRQCQSESPRMSSDSTFVSLSPREQLRLEVSELHDWATQQGRYKGSHIGIKAGQRALAQTYSVDALDKEWFTPLHAAILADRDDDNFDRVAFLVRKGAQINRICMLGLDPMQLCKPESKAIRALLERRAHALKIRFTQQRYGPDVTIVLNQERFQALSDEIKNKLLELQDAASQIVAKPHAITEYKFFLLKCGLIDGIRCDTCSVLMPKKKILAL